MDKYFADGRVTKRFANRLRGYSHLHVDEMITIFRGAKELTRILALALKLDFERCKSCQETGSTEMFYRIIVRQGAPNFQLERPGGLFFHIRSQ